ncbi:MAG: GGDEF domain-containing protein [Acidobacteria bacterium]|nr:GGDEF domain-containing protein [Acidobacteriota bacterium]
MLPAFSDADSKHVQETSELRGHLARALQGHAPAIVKDTLGVYPFAGMDNVPADDRAHLAELACQLISTAVRDGALEAEHPIVDDLARFASDRHADIRVLFTVVYLIERSALDQLALDDSFDVESLPWAALTQIVRRASFDTCAAVAGHLNRKVPDTGIIDPLTTLYNRAVFVAALDREIQRSERFGHSFALLALDVDHLNDINTRHGYGAGDRVLERVGIVVRTYFRETDWVARLGEDTFAVLLPETQGVDAERLADRMRVTVQERLQLHDHRSEEDFRVTLSVGVVIAAAVDRKVRAEQLLTLAYDAIDRAKKTGRNRVERVAVPTG